MPTIASPASTGKYVYLGTEVTLTQFRASDGKVLQTISPVGESGVFPFTVNSANTRAYVCLGKHAGFDVVNLETGKVTDRVYATDPGTDRKIRHRTHGAGMNPSETELWISDQKGKKLFIFDLTKVTPLRLRGMLSSAWEAMVGSPLAWTEPSLIATPLTFSMPAPRNGSLR